MCDWFQLFYNIFLVSNRTYRNENFGYDGKTLSVPGACFVRYSSIERRVLLPYFIAISIAILLIGQPT